MLNWFARLFLVATSLSPVLGAVAVNKIAQGNMWWPWLVSAVALVIICWGVLYLATRQSATQQVTIAEFDANDKEVLAFLLAYLLPFISRKDMTFEGEWLTGVYILVIIFIVVAHAGAFHFNPVMGLLGYHFYGIKNQDGVSQLLISREEYRKRGKEVKTVRLAHNVYLATGE